MGNESWKTREEALTGFKGNGASRNLRQFDFKNLLLRQKLTFSRTVGMYRKEAVCLFCFFFCFHCLYA